MTEPRRIPRGRTREPPKASFSKGLGGKRKTSQRDGKRIGATRGFVPERGHGAPQRKDKGEGCSREERRTFANRRGEIERVADIKKSQTQLKPCTFLKSKDSQDSGKTIEAKTTGQRQ